MDSDELSLHGYLALATVLLKFKPQGIMLEDYFSALRYALTEPQGADTNIFDGLKLWHGLFSKIQRHSLDVRAELVVLRSLQEPVTQEQTVPRDGRKRKSSVYAPNKANTYLKRQRIEAPLDFENAPDVVHVMGQHQDRSLLLRVVYGLGRCPQESPAQPDGLTHLICLASEAMLEGLDNTIDTSTSMQAATDEPLLLNESCAAIQHIWTHVMLHLTTTATKADVHVDHDMITPHLCPIVQRLLGRLYQYCLDEAREMAQSTKKGRQSKKSNTKIMTSKTTQRINLFNHNCNAVATCLAYILNKANDIQQLNTDLFQALAVTFLEHLGSSLSFRLFVDPDTTSRFGGILPPRGLLNTADIDQKIVLQATKLEAPHLVKILKALMQHKHQKKKTVPGSEKSEALNVAILRHLQESLLRGIFEKKTETTSVCTDLSWKQNLNDTSLNDGDQEDLDWFLSQIWDVLGWDIILKDPQPEFGSFL